MKSVMNVANVRPPTIATPIAMRLGVPVRMSGTAPNTVERLVMRIGRKRRSAAIRAASSLLHPVFSAIWFANSTIKIPFFVTRAINKIKAISLKMLSVWPVTYKLTNAPESASGTVKKITNGARKLSNCPASTRNTSASASKNTTYNPEELSSNSLDEPLKVVLTLG